MQSLDPRIRLVWIVKYGSIVLLASAAALFYDLLNLLQGEQMLLPYLTAPVLTGGLGLILVIVLAHFHFKVWQYDLHTEELYLEHGIWRHTNTIVPLRRVQHLDVSQNVLERNWNLGRLVIYTAGTQQNSITLPGLPIQKAREMRDTIRQYVIDSRV